MTAELQIQLGKLDFALVLMRRRAEELWIEPDPVIRQIWCEAVDALEKILVLLDEARELPEISAHERAEIAALERLLTLEDRR